MPWPAVGGFGLRPPEILRTKNPSSQRRARSPGRVKVNYPNEPPERGRINRPPGAIVKAYHLSSPIGNCGPVDAPKLRRGRTFEKRYLFRGGRPFFILRLRGGRNPMGNASIRPPQ